MQPRHRLFLQWRGVPEALQALLTAVALLEGIAAQEVVTSREAVDCARRKTVIQVPIIQTTSGVDPKLGMIPRFLTY